MKQINQLLSLAVVILLFTSCQGSGGKKENTTDDTTTNVSDTILEHKMLQDCGNRRTFVISEADAAKMITHFETVFGAGADPKLNRNYWIQSSVILAFDEFLAKDPEYDGVRFYFGEDGTSTVVMMVPTKGDYIKHVDQHVKLINHAPIAGSRVLFNLDEKAEFEPFYTAFLRDFRKEFPGCDPLKINDSLSKAVWINKCVINEMAVYMSGTAYKLDGMRVHLSAYDKLMPEVPHQKVADQSTVVFVVTEDDLAGGHKDNWKIIPEIYKEKLAIFGGGGYNHGDLCPNNCN